MCKDNNDDSIWIQPCYCLYFDQASNKSVVGNCMLSCYHVKFSQHAKGYYEIGRESVLNATTFNNEICNSSVITVGSNREGRFCGRCKEGYGLAAYSYHYTTCIPCTDYGYKNWIKYFTVALLPLTLFYFLVVILRINATSSRLNGIVFIIQCALSSQQLKVLDGWIVANTRLYSTYSKEKIVIILLISTLGIVNLDFFRDVYPDFCLHPRMNILHVVSLDYIVALYPFLLIFITYVLITIYDNNYRLLVWAWKPFKRCLGCYRKHFNIKSSLIETFATFILLSNVKILGVCLDLLVYTRSYDATGSQGKLFLYYDANIEYFSREHLPFAILALSVGFVFVFLPFLLLVLYPCRCFQRCLNHFGWRCQALHVFMDAFQGSYKTEPYDLRYFSAYYLLFRFALLLLSSIIKSLFFVPATLLLMLLGTATFSVIQPYKNRLHNQIDIIALSLLALFYSAYSADVFASYINFRWLPFAQVTLTVIILLAVISLLMWMLFHLKVSTLLKKIQKRVGTRKQERLQPIEEFARHGRDCIFTSGHETSALLDAKK